MTAKIKRLHPDAILPQYQTPGSVGFDLHALEETKIASGELCLVRTGIAVSTPVNHMLMLVPRSSTFKKKGLMMPHSIGVIDQDYSGDQDELLLQFLSLSADEITIEKGERIAQGIFARVGRFWWQEVDSLGDSRGGFGSTDESRSVQNA